MKRGFALIMAMIFIVLVATIGALGLSFASKSAKQAGDVYLKEQAEILALNAVDYTIMAMQMHDYTQNCLEEVVIFYPNANTPLYKIKVDLYYANNTIVNGIGPCSVAHRLPNSISIDPATEISYNAAIIDVVVEGTPNSDPNLRYVYRTTAIP
ncbi:MAG: type II secretion system protein [Campylobacter sp.]|nr:type II secretion system protein [Campylobacter sp.]